MFKYVAFSIWKNSLAFLEKNGSTRTGPQMSNPKPKQLKLTEYKPDSQTKNNCCLVEDKIKLPDPMQDSGIDQWYF